MPNPDTPPPDNQVPRPWQPRFGLAGMFLVTLVFSVMAAAGSYFIQSLRGGKPMQLMFILFTLATPLLLLVLVSLVFSLLSWIARRN